VVEKRILSFSLVNTLISGADLEGLREIADDRTISAARTIRRTSSSPVLPSPQRTTGWWPAFWMTTRMFFAAASSVVCAV